MANYLTTEELLLRLSLINKNFSSIVKKLKNYDTSWQYRFVVEFMSEA